MNDHTDIADLRRELQRMRQVNTALRRRLDACNANYVGAMTALDTVTKAVRGAVKMPGPAMTKALEDGERMVAEAGTLGRHMPGRRYTDS